MALRYLIVQVVSGVLLMGGSVLHLQETGSLAFDALTLDGTAGIWILTAFAIKAAFPMLHGWAIEAYPQPRRPEPSCSAHSPPSWPSMPSRGVSPVLKC